MVSKKESNLCNCGSDRRTFLKTAGMAGLAFSGLPQVASAISGNEYHTSEIMNSLAVKAGKANHITCYIRRTYMRNYIPMMNFSGKIIFRFIKEEVALRY